MPKTKSDITYEQAPTISELKNFLALFDKMPQQGFVIYRGRNYWTIRQSGDKIVNAGAGFDCAVKFTKTKVLFTLYDNTRVKGEFEVNRFKQCFRAEEHEFVAYTDHEVLNIKF